MASSKREQILASALTLFVEQGISDTSTSSIAKTAGVATGTLFHHFANKQAIVDGLYRHLKEQIAGIMTAQTIEQDYIAQAKNYWLTSLDWYLENTQALKFFRLYYATPSIQRDNKCGILQETLGFFIDFIDQAIEAGLFIDLPQEYIISHCQQGLFNTAQFLIDNPELLATDIKQKSFTINFNALLAPQAVEKLAQAAQQ